MIKRKKCRGEMLLLLAILLLFGSGVSGAAADASLLAPSSPVLGNGRCNTPPCTCDQYGRLTCDCKDAAEELILTGEGERGLSRHTSRINITDCASVVLSNHSLAQMDGFLSLDITNVANLTLSRHSLKLSPKAVNVRLSLTNASLDVMPSNVFHGDIESIFLDNVRIGRLAAFAFANLLNTNIISLKNCQVEEVEALAFKKFEVHFLHVTGGSLGRDELPSRAINDVEVQEKVLLDGVRMGVVRSSAFVIKRPNTLAIQNCQIESLESEAFDIGVRSNVLIQDNSFGHVAFGAFLSIRADPDNRPPGLYSLRFEDNNLTSFEGGSLVFDRTSFRTELENVLVNQACDCESLSLWKSQILNYTNVHSRLISSRDSTSIVAPPYSLESSAEEPETFLCLDEPEEAGSPSSFADYEARNCVLGGNLLVLVSSVCGLLISLALAACLVVYCCRKRRRDAQKRWISVPTSAPDVVSSKQAKNGNASSAIAGAQPVDSRITMVVPDGRLYRETEFHVIVEKAEPLTTEL